MSTMCIDTRRVDDDYVCIYKAKHDHFAFPTHLAQSSWNEISSGDDNWDYYYNYFIVAKAEYYDGVEVILYSSCDKKHTYELLEGCQKKDKDALFYFENCYDYRVIRVPIYKYIPYNLTSRDGEVYHGHRQKLHILGDEFKLYCPKDLNKKYKVYGTFGERKKNGKGCYWKGPRTLKRR